MSKMDKYINIDLQETYQIFESLDIISESVKIKIDNLLECKGINHEGLIRKHQLSYDLPELKIAMINHGYVSSNGFIHTGEGVIYSNLQFNKEMIIKQVEQEQDNKIINIDKVIPLLRAGDHIYGHWLVDILPIVWLSRRVQDIDTYKYLVRSNIPSYAIEFLSYFNVQKSDLILIDAKTKVNFDSAIYISNLRYNQIMHPMIKEFATELKKLILTTPTDLTTNKIYLSRGKWKSFRINKVRELINREEVESCFQAEEYDIIYPEKYNLVEQVNIFSNIKALAGEDGSALHNSIFMDEGTTVICLKGKKNHSIIQGSLCFAMGQNISYAIGDTKSEPSDRNSSYSIDTHDLKDLF